MLQLALSHRHAPKFRYKYEIDHRESNNLWEWMETWCIKLTCFRYSLQAEAFIIIAISHRPVLMKITPRASFCLASPLNARFRRRGCRSKRPKKKIKETRTLWKISRGSRIEKPRRDNAKSRQVKHLAEIDVKGKSHPLELIEKISNY